MEKTRKYYKITFSINEPSSYYTRTCRTLDQAIKLSTRPIVGTDLMSRSKIEGTDIESFIPFTSYNVKRNVRKTGFGKISGTNGTASIMKKTVSKEEFIKLKTHYIFLNE